MIIFSTDLPDFSKSSFVRLGEVAPFAPRGDANAPNTPPGKTRLDLVDYFIALSRSSIQTLYACVSPHVSSSVHGTLLFIVRVDRNSELAHCELRHEFTG